MIKQLDNDDKAAVKLSQQCFKELRKIYRPTKIAEKKKEQETNEWQSFGFYANEVLVAVVEAKLLGSELQIRSLTVDSNFRRQGIARNLLNATISSFPSANSISVWCVEQTGNVAIFHALGFKVVQRFESDYFVLANGEKAVEVQLKQKITSRLSL